MKPIFKRRIAAPEVEQRVAAAAREMLGDRPALALALEQSGLEPHRLPAVLKAALAWFERLTSKSEAAPAIVEAVVAGRQPPDLTVIQLLRRLDLPLLWSTQEQVIGLRR